MEEKARREKILHAYLDKLEATGHATAYDSIELQLVANDFSTLLGEELANNIVREYKMRTNAWILARKVVGKFSEEDKAFLDDAEEITNIRLKEKRTIDTEDYKAVLEKYKGRIPDTRMADLLILFSRDLQYSLFFNAAKRGKTQINSGILDFPQDKIKL